MQIAKFLRVIGLAGLALVVLPAFLMIAGVLDMPTNKALMLIGTVLWFASAPWVQRFQRDHKSGNNSVKNPSKDLGKALPNNDGP